MMRPVIVMAGTPVDTQMGMDCLAAQGVEGVFCSISKDPVEQTAFQISSEREKAAVVTALFREAQAAHGCEQAFFYCNSLSGSVDFDAIARETGVVCRTGGGGAAAALHALPILPGGPGPQDPPADFRPGAGDAPAAGRVSRTP